MKIVRNIDGTYSLGKVKLIKKSWNPCAYCRIEHKCDDEVNEYCKTHLAPNECFEIAERYK